MFFRKYPDAIDPGKIGSYPAEAFSGGGYFYDDVLEYRVWMKENNTSVYYAFPTYGKAKKFHMAHPESQRPVALVRQNSYVEEDGDDFRQINKTRVTEWDVTWLKGNKDTGKKIPAFIAQHNGK